MTRLRISGTSGRGEPRLDVLRHGIQRACREGALLRGDAQAVQELLALEVLATTVSLHHRDGGAQELLQRGELLVAAVTLALPSNA